MRVSIIIDTVWLITLFLKDINFNIEATMVGRVMKSQEVLKLIDKTHLRDKTVNFGKEKSGRDYMKEGRLQRVKVQLNTIGQ